MEVSWFICLTIVSLTLLKSAEALECYACENQDSNKDKCIKTTKQCEEHQDICKTMVAWQLPPYWVPYGDRHHFLWKDCDTTANCENEKAAMMPFCKRDWYDDWRCTECCTGDLCNYYVTLGSSSVASSVILILLSSCFVFFMR